MKVTMFKVSKTLAPKSLLSAVILLAASSVAAADTVHPKGYWLTDDKAVIVGVDNCTSSKNALCGIIVAVPGAKTDKRLKANAKKLCGAPVFWDVKKQTGKLQWSGGKILDLETGKRYGAQVSVKGGKLNVRAYQGTPTLGETFRWTRATNFKPCKAPSEF